jgi:hypothetical protein|tara:strand:+ start:275 stop:487 length:213 start_codon:yes stop_codon:yes gene_type:complete
MSFEAVAFYAALFVAVWVLLDVIDERKKRKEKAFETKVERARYFAYREGKWPEEIDQIEIDMRKKWEGIQ